MGDTATEAMVAMEAMVDTVTTTARGRLRLMPTMAMVDMEDTDIATEAMVAMEAMVDTDTTTARGRLSLSTVCTVTVSTTADTPASLLSTTVDTPASPPPPPCISPAT